MILPIAPNTPHSRNRSSGPGVYKPKWPSALHKLGPDPREARVVRNPSPFRRFEDETEKRLSEICRRASIAWVNPGTGTATHVCAIRACVQRGHRCGRT